MKKTSPQFIKDTALALGFDACGIAEAKQVDFHVEHYFSQWLEERKFGHLHFFEKHKGKHYHPEHILKEAKSVIMLACNYSDSKNETALTGKPFKIAQYALGKDYHIVLQHKLSKFMDILQSEYPGTLCRSFVDTAPLPEKYWAKKCGLGNYGKNTLLILPQKGTYFFLAGILCSLDISSDDEFTKDLCGDCSLCIQACPTGALEKPFQLNAAKCISALTVEQKDDFSEDTPSWKEWIWGCDVCQQVCPHNIRHRKETNSTFTILPQVEELLNGNIEADEEKFKQELRGTVFLRGGFSKLPRNIRHISEK